MLVTAKFGLFRDGPKSEAKILDKILFYSPHPAYSNYKAGGTAQTWPDQVWPCPLSRAHNLYCTPI